MKALQTILIIRLSAIGDIVMASPVAAALKQRDPQTKVLWLTQPECASLVQNNPVVDEVIIWPRAQWQTLWQQRQFGKLWREIRNFRQMLKSKQINTAIDLQGLLKSGILTWLSGARKKIGLGSKEGSQWLMHQVIDRDSGDTEMIGSEYRWLCQQLHLPTSPWQMTMGASEQAISNVDTLIKENINSSYIVICPFTTRPQKHWLDNGWQQLIPKLVALNSKVIMLGGPGDIDHAERLISSELVTETNNKLINLVGKTSLQEAALLIQQAQAVVGVDTGLTHMGHAHNVPTIALFGSTRPYLKTDTSNSQIIYLNMHCSPCRRNPTCDGRFDCLSDISADAVFQQLQTTLAMTEQSIASNTAESQAVKHVLNNE